MKDTHWPILIPNILLCESGLPPSLGTVNYNHSHPIPGPNFEKNSLILLPHSSISVSADALSSTQLPFTSVEEGEEKKGIDQQNGARGMMKTSSAFTTTTTFTPILLSSSDASPLCGNEKNTSSRVLLRKPTSISSPRTGAIPPTSTSSNNHNNTSTNLQGSFNAESHPIEGDGKTTTLHKEEEVKEEERQRSRSSGTGLTERCPERSVSCQISPRSLPVLSKTHQDLNSDGGRNSRNMPRRTKTKKDDEEEKSDNSSDSVVVGCGGGSRGAGAAVLGKLQTTQVYLSRSSISPMQSLEDKESGVITEEDQDQGEEVEMVVENQDQGEEVGTSSQHYRKTFTSDTEPLKISTSEMGEGKKKEQTSMREMEEEMKEGDLSSSPSPLSSQTDTITTSTMARNMGEEKIGQLGDNNASHREASSSPPPVRTIDLASLRMTFTSSSANIISHSKENGFSGGGSVLEEYIPFGRASSGTTPGLSDLPPSPNPSQLTGLRAEGSGSSLSSRGGGEGGEGGADVIGNMSKVEVEDSEEMNSVAFSHNKKTEEVSTPSVENSAIAGRKGELSPFTILPSSPPVVPPTHHHKVQPSSSMEEKQGGEASLLGPPNCRDFLTAGNSGGVPSVSVSSHSSPDRCSEHGRNSKDSSSTSPANTDPSSDSDTSSPFPFEEISGQEITRDGVSEEKGEGGNGAMPTTAAAPGTTEKGKDRIRKTRVSPLEDRKRDERREGIAAPAAISTTLLSGDPHPCSKKGDEVGGGEEDLPGIHLTSIIRGSRGGVLQPPHATASELYSPPSPLEPERGEEDGKKSSRISVMVPPPPSASSFSSSSSPFSSSSIRLPPSFSTRDSTDSSLCSGAVPVKHAHSANPLHHHHYYHHHCSNTPPPPKAYLTKDASLLPSFLRRTEKESDGIHRRDGNVVPLIVTSVERRNSAAPTSDGSRSDYEREEEGEREDKDGSSRYRRGTTRDGPRHHPEADGDGENCSPPPPSLPTRMMNMEPIYSSISKESEHEREDNEEEEGGEGKPYYSEKDAYVEKKKRGMYTEDAKGGEAVGDTIVSEKKKEEKEDHLQHQHGDLAVAENAGPASREVLPTGSEGGGRKIGGLTGGPHPSTTVMISTKKKTTTAGILPPSTAARLGSKMALPRVAILSRKPSSGVPSVGVGGEGDGGNDGKARGTSSSTSPSSSGGIGSGAGSKNTTGGSLLRKRQGMLDTPARTTSPFMSTEEGGVVVPSSSKSSAAGSVLKPFSTSKSTKPLVPSPPAFLGDGRMAASAASPAATTGGKKDTTTTNPPPRTPAPSSSFHHQSSGQQHTGGSPLYPLSPPPLSRTSNCLGSSAGNLYSSFSRTGVLTDSGKPKTAARAIPNSLIRKQKPARNPLPIWR